MSDSPDFAGVPEDIQRVVAEHKAQYARAIAQGAAAERVQGVLAERGGASATSLRGEVTVSVAASGLLQDVRIQQRGLDAGAAGLSRLLTSTLRQALVNLEESAAEGVAEADGGVVGAAMLAEIRTGLATPLAALDSDGTEIRER
jgi:hypothetical protein